LASVFESTSFGFGNVIALSQETCIELLCKNPVNPDNPYFLKDLSYFSHLTKLASIEDVLLIDDSLEKNLLNNCHNVIHPQSCSSNMRDHFFIMVLKPWLCGFLIQTKLLRFMTMDPLSSIGNMILKDFVVED